MVTALHLPHHLLRHHCHLHHLDLPLRCPCMDMALHLPHQHPGHPLRHPCMDMAPHLPHLHQSDHPSRHLCMVMALLLLNHLPLKIPQGKPMALPASLAPPPLDHTHLPQPPLQPHYLLLNPLPFPPQHMEHPLLHPLQIPSPQHHPNPQHHPPPQHKGQVCLCSHQDPLLHHEECSTRKVKLQSSSSGHLW